MAGQGKEKKRDEAAKDGGKKDEVTALLRQLTEQVASIRADVDGLKSGGDGGASSGKSRKSAAPSADGENAPIDDAEVARLGYAFSSPQKVALVRLLLTGGEQTAAQLGDQAGLTTGSLYHHLRELIHADVLTQQNRNRYALTDRGRHAALALAALVSEQ